MRNLAKMLKIEAFSLVYWFFYHLPGYHFSNKLRAKFVGVFLKNSGKNLVLNREVILESPQNIEIGNDVGINARAWISGGGGMVIGDNVLIGPHVVIVTANHDFSDLNKPIAQQGHVQGKVIIGNNVWIGAGAVILPGVTIGDNVVIGAGSVVSRSALGNAVYAGNPARKIKDR